MTQALERVGLCGFEGGLPRWERSWLLILIENELVADIRLHHGLLERLSEHRLEIEFVLLSFYLVFPQLTIVLYLSVYGMRGKLLTVCKRVDGRILFALDARLGETYHQV